MKEKYDGGTMIKIELFKLLSCKTRFDIMNMLINNEHICICHLESKLGLSQANASKHMRIFRELDIVETEKLGKSVFYQLTPEFKKDHELLLKYIDEGDSYVENCSIC